MDETFKDIFNTWGTYRSLLKDVELVKFFLNRPEQSIRQKTIIKHFDGKMSPKAVRTHLKSLLDKRIIEEDPVYRGTYVFFPVNYRKMGIDMDRLIQAIVGADIYDIAVSIWKSKNIQSENTVEKQDEPIEDEIDKEVRRYEQELDDYTRGYY